ncbi:GntR family transcriptional regulator [Oryzibacter oryziterrae]|uniref:GntR family transcriptional regulator n=1 Tax=Oryzibacter oryziterrae TaxID=2766474 RepID=UPI001F1B48E9|nr:GntR family transcriptional regulator [Oryzibacter oryziterrae]
MLQKSNLADQIAAILQERIVAGDIPADSALKQDALAAEFGVSKIPLREAFAKLQQNGLVTSQANRGFFVRPLSSAEAFDVFDLRLRIEPDAAARGAERADAAALEATRRAFEALHNAVAVRSSRVGAFNRAFHMALIQPAGAPVTLEMIERLHVIGERYVVRHLRPEGRTERAQAEHAALYSAWKDRDAARVRDLGERHIAATLADLRAELDAE